MPIKTIDLCAGIGGMRKGFELTGAYQNVIAAEIDHFACLTYTRLFGEDAFNDLTSDEFKSKLDLIPYDVLLAGFPCQTFSKAGLEEGFNDKEKGIIFSHIADIIQRTRPRAVFLENVDNLVRHDKGNTFKVIIETLEILLDYKVTSSYKAMQALGFYKVDVPTSEVYKTGAKKGQPKYTKEWRTGGIRHILEWAIQVNYYRVLLEKHNFHVDDMYIQIYVRDYSLRMASERNITKPIYLIKINKISNVWLSRYFKAKRDRLAYAITNERLPNFCSNKETWSGKKCEQYCNVYDECRRLYESSTIADGAPNNTAA